MRRWALCLLVWGTAARADYMDHFVVREDVGLHKAPSIGAAKVLLIPVEVAGYPPLDLPGLERFFSADEPAGFVRYYETASLGRYTPQVSLTPVVRYATCPLPLETFPGCKVGRGDIAAFAAGIDMIRDVVRKLRDGGFDFSAHDVNGRNGEPDGYVDGVMLLTNTSFGGIAFPFAYFNRGDDLAGGSGGALQVSGVQISHVAIGGSGNRHVMVHEFGHLLGLTDLYDESQRYDGLAPSVMGAWGYDDQIPLPDAETRYRLRWANVHQVVGEQRVTIPPVESSGEVWRLGTGDEYFLIENRGPGGAFDRSLAERGLAVFHVDRRVKLRGEEGRFVDRLLDCVNCDPWHPYIRLAQADGDFEVQDNRPFSAPGDFFQDGDELRPDDSGEPLAPAHRVESTNWYSGEASGFSITRIKARPDDRIEVTLAGPKVDACGDPLCADGVGCKPVTCAPAGCASVGGPALTALGALAYFLRKRASAASTWRSRPA